MESDEIVNFLSWLMEQNIYLCKIGTGAAVTDVYNETRIIELLKIASEYINRDADGK